MKIEHIAMYVNDLESAKEFFIKYFDAAPNNEYHNLKTNFRSYFLSFNDGARLELMNKPNMLDCEKLTAKLLSDGYEVISGPRTSGDGYYESSVICFEGNQIELTI